MGKISNPVYSAKDVDDTISIFVNKEFKNMKVANHIATKEFVKRGFKPHKIQLLFENNLEPKDLSQDEKIAFLLGAYNYFLELKDDTKKNEQYIQNMNPELYYYSNTIHENKLIRPINTNETPEIIVFEDVTKINNTEFQFVLKASKLSEMYKQSNIVYLDGFQRAKAIKKLPNGVTIKVENYNKKGIESLKERYRKQNLLVTQITLGVITFTTPDIQFIPRYHDIIGDIEFKPNKDSFICILDGAHRRTSSSFVWEKYGIDNDISVAFKILTEEQATQYISDTFERNETSREFTNTLKRNKENIFLDNIIKNCWFNNRIAKHKAELALGGMVGRYSNMIDIIKKFDMDISNETISEITANKMSKIINQLHDLLNIEGFNDKIEENISYIYLIASYKLINKSVEDIMNLSNIIKEKEKLINKTLKNKSMLLLFENINKILDMEVVENV